MEKVSKRRAATAPRLAHEILYRNLDWAAETAAYYGFSPSNFPDVTKTDREKAAEVQKEDRDTDEGYLPFFDLASRIAVLRDYQERRLDKEAQPVLLAHSSKKGDSKIYHFGLEILGSSKSIADATVIKTAYEILRGHDFNNLVVAVNSMGDRESFGRFVREFTNHSRKNLDGFNTSCRADFKKNPLRIMNCGHEKCGGVLADAPKPMGTLSEPSRIHFKEVLEYIEILGIPYRIEDTLIADRTFGCQTVFRIVDDEKGQTVATGVRYNILARKIGFKKELPTVGARIELRDASKITHSRKIEKPLVCFVQIGFEAKLKSLQVVEMLRSAKIPTYQSLSRDKLSSQLQIAENLKIPFALIMGQKEAVENSVIVRNTNNRSQETVPLPQLSHYLAKLIR
ncbi:MAG: hypothetical protein HYV68_02405 [Candidatus Taylorbacteria bacterium]|nr:hypothetical protein [Candidatus Taylorbacteria bacterium]